MTLTSGTNPEFLLAMSRTYSRRRGDRSLSREHVKRHRCERNFFFRSKRQIVLGIYETANQPTDADRHTGSRTRNPHPAFVVRGSIFGVSKFPVTTRAASAFRKQFSPPGSHRDSRNNHVDNLLESVRNG